MFPLKKEKARLIAADLMYLILAEKPVIIKTFGEVTSLNTSIL